MMTLGALAMVLVFAASAGFAAVEVALVRVDLADSSRPAVRSSGRSHARGADRVNRAVEDLPTSLAGAQFGITLCSVGVGVLAAPVIADGLDSLFGGDGDTSAAIWVVIALLITIAVQMLFGELVPKAIGADRALGVARWLTPPLRVFVTLSRPLLVVSSSIARAVMSVVGVDAASAGADVRSRSELRRIVERSVERGSITRSDAARLEKTLRFAQKRAADALTPRVSVEALGHDASVAELIETSRRTGLSRFPVHRGDLDHISGVVHIKDVLGVDHDHRGDEPIDALVRPVVAVPESKDLESLMVQLRDERGQFAIVVDEYGGTAGIVTLEDVVEEIVGEIDDEHDPAITAPAVRRWGGAHMVAGRLRADELADACQFELPEGGYETLGGFVMDRLGRIPAVGDRFDHEGWQLEVTQMDGRRVATVKLVAPQPSLIVSQGRA